MVTNPSREKEIFEQAFELGSAEERRDYLKRTCGEDAALLARIEALLHANEAAEDLLPDQPKDTIRLVFEKPGDWIGRYKLLQQIGEGGCGIVYMAEQSEPVRRRVALKIIKLGMDTKSVIARFEAERQALALMEHPNIAKVFDAGATETGRPFFVMELVRGIKITEYCDQNSLSTNKRLKLFTQVCQAIQHAHQKGVIHRDIKPSNILVTVNDAVAVPKIIDFGIAKATNQQPLTDKTVFTAFEQFIGTPAYMSPEQAVMTSLDIDTRTDIYSLGVLLYEMLTGKTPFDANELLKSGLDEMRHTIRDKEPMRPSTRLSTMHEGELTTTAKHRQTEAPKLIHLLRGDLDWIVMKALEKDRTRRYETANGLARDVQRYLENEPVAARPPSRLYRFQKLIRRNKLAFSAGSAVALALLFGVVASMWQAVRATHFKELAEGETKRATRAETEAKEKLWTSYLAQARAGRLSGEVGRRTDSLAALAAAAQMRVSLELRNEAIACLALTDLGPPTMLRPANATNNFEVVACDGNLGRCAVRHESGSLTVERVRDGAVLAELTTPFWGHPNTSMEFSHDGHYLRANFAVGPGTGCVWLWDLNAANASARTNFPALRDSPHAAAFSPDSRTLTVAGLDGVIHFFDLATGAESPPLNVGVTAYRIDWAPSGRFLAVTFQRSVQIWQADSGQQLTKVSHVADIVSADWHPDSRRLALGDINGGLFLWDTQTGLKHILAGHSQYVSRVAFDPQGDLLVSRSWDSTSKFWDTTTGQWLFGTQQGNADQFSRDGRRLSFLRQGGAVGVWNIVRSDCFCMIKGPTLDEPHLQGVDVSGNGQWLVFGEARGWHLWDVRDARELASVPSQEGAGPLFAHDGKSVFTRSGERILRWPLNWEEDPADSGSSGVGLRNRPRVRVGLPQVVFSNAHRDFQNISLSNDGELLAVAGQTVSFVIGLKNPSHPVEFSRGLRQSRVSVSPDHRWLAAGAFAASGVTLWDLHTGAFVRQLVTNENAQVAFSPDGRTLLTATEKEYCFWNTDSWQVRRRAPLELANSSGGPIAFSRDGKLLALAPALQQVLLLDPGTGEELARLTSPQPRNLSALALSADGGQLAGATLDGVVHLWDLHSLHRELAALNLDWLASR